MKKLLTLFTLLLTVCSGAWATDETPGNTGTKDTELTGTSFSIPGTFIAGAGGVKVGTMSTKGVKIRMNKSYTLDETELTNVLVILVKEGYRLDAFTVDGVTNTDNKTGSIISVKVDGTEKLASSVTIPKKNGSTSGKITLNDISATQHIVITFGTSEASQANLDFHFTYSLAAPGAISFSPAAGSVETGSNITLSSSGANTILYQWGASAVDGDGNWSGAITYDNEHKPVVPSVGSSDNVLSVKATNTNGSTYGSATYTITAAKTATVTTINSSGITNLDVKTSKDAGTLTAGVTAGGSPVGGATVTWASSDESIVKVGETTGVVTLVAAGDANITATYAGDETYAASFDVYAIEVEDSRKHVTLSFTSNTLNDYNYDGETLTAPTLTAKDQNNNTIDLAELPELSFAVDKEDVVSVNAETGAITAANTNNFGTSTVTVSFPGNSNYKSAASKSYTVTRAPMLYQVKFDNGFEGFIEEGTKKVNVFYMAGTSAPAQTGTIKKADGYTANVVGNTVVLTKDTHTKTYNIVPTAKTPFEGTGKQTFSAVPDYVASVYGYNSDKGLKFSKKKDLDESKTDWEREAKGNSRLYFFVGAANSITFTHKGDSRDVMVRVNGGDAQSQKGTFTVNLNEDQPNMIEIQSNQTSGDGGFKDMTLTSPKKAVNISSAGYATFSSTEKLDFTDVTGLTAYKATTTGESSVTLEDVTGIVPAETGLLLKGDAKTYYIPMSTETATADVDGNLLQSTATAEYEVTGEEKGTAYVFGKLVDEVGFFKAAVGKKIGVGKSWLLVPGTGAKDVEFLSFVFGDEESETTAIKAVVNEQAREGVYDLQGRKVTNPSKGLYIVNGKKVIIK